MSTGGKVVKEGDDLMCATRYALMMLRHASTAKYLMCATRYALMMLRHASTAKSHYSFRGQIDYPKQGWI